MKRLLSLAAVIGVVLLGASMLCAQVPVVNWVQHYWAPQYFDSGATVTGLVVNGMTLNGVPVATTNVVNGNIPIVNLTNALPSAGSYIGGNIKTNALTNAVVGTMWKGLPTSTNGLASGQLWLNSNVLTIFP